MPSYQDIEARLGRVERMLEFVATSFKIQTQHPLLPNVVTIKSLLDLYRDQLSGVVSEGEVIDVGAPAEDSMAKSIRDQIEAGGVGLNG